MELNILFWKLAKKFQDEIASMKETISELETKKKQSFTSLAFILLYQSQASFTISYSLFFELLKNIFPGFVSVLIVGKLSLKVCYQSSLTTPCLLSQL